VALAVDIVQFITVFIVATDIRTTVAGVTIITITTTITGLIDPTGRTDPTGRIDRPLNLYKDPRGAWVVPPCREAVVAVVVAVVVVARFGWAQV